MKFEKFFLYCSGADAAILERCPTDRNKFIGIGATVFFTGVLAFFSSAYALFTVFENWLAAGAFGLVWGLMIFNLDRYIVMSMKSYGKWWRDWLVALPRMLLAGLLALVISKPLELKIFEKEIQAELVVMEQEMFKSQEDGVKARFQTQLDDKRLQISQLKIELTSHIARRDSLSRLAVQEADGTGGSRQRNLGPIYMAKKADADRAQAELNAFQTRALPQLAELEKSAQSIDNQRQTEASNLQRSRFDGLAARLEALARLAKGSAAISLASLFIMLLFVAIETAPIMVKLISYRSPYDHILQETEHVFEMATLESTTLRGTATHNKLKYETETGAHEVAARITAQNAEIDRQLREKLEELKGTFSFG